MEVCRGSVYLYEFSNYEHFIADLEALIELNHDYRFTLFTRLPTRRLIDKLDLSLISNYWITRQTAGNTLPPDIAEISRIIEQSSDDESNFFVLDGLELMDDEGTSNNLLASLSLLFDKIKARNDVFVICIDSLAFDSEWMVKLQYLTEKLVVKSPEIVAITEEVSDAVEPIEVPLQHELGIDGGPRLAYLAKLPEFGFTKEILVKRILQWRRLGLDVSAIEPALAYQEKEAYQLYKLIEEKVRRATELERFIHANRHDLDATQIAVDMFRVRQLTGLDELEKKYYSSP